MLLIIQFNRPGLSWSGTAVVLHADTIGALLKQVVPGLEVYKALPVEAVHPKFETMFCTGDIMASNCNSTIPTTCDFANSSATPTAGCKPAPDCDASSKFPC